MRFSTLALAGLTALSASTAALAAPPLLTPDADVLQSGNCQTDFGVRRIRMGASGQQAAHSNTQTLSGDCGLGKGFQLGLTASHGRAFGESAHHIGLNLKYQLLTIGQNGPTLSLIGGLSQTRSQGDWDYDGGGIGLAMTQRRGAHEFHASLTRELPHGEDRTWRSSLAYGFQVSPEWTLLAELSDARRERPMLGAGVRYQPAALKGWSFGAGRAPPEGRDRRRAHQRLLAEHALQLLIARHAAAPHHPAGPTPRSAAAFCKAGSRPNGRAITALAARGMRRRICGPMPVKMPCRWAWWPCWATKPAALRPSRRNPLPATPRLAPGPARAVVPAALRRQGIGRALLQGLEAQARGLGLPRLYCATATSASLLQRCGWRLIEHNAERRPAHEHL